MIAGISYNIFNAHEHLAYSLKSVRPCVEYINVVVQWTSNVGQPADTDLPALIEALRADGLIDQILVYEPDLSVHPSRNEWMKRSRGLSFAKAAGVTHFMTMDADEYYVQSEFMAAKNYIIANNIISSAVPTYLHIKRPIWRSFDTDTTCCAFLTCIDDESMLDHDGFYPVLVDPTRRLRGHAKSFHFFDPETIAMRHMNLVRCHGLDDKLRNSTNATMTDFISRVRTEYERWEFGQDLYFPGKPPIRIIQVQDLFCIDHIFKKY